MELPYKSKAHVPLEKITDYLLSETHAVGKSKARYFRSYGYDNRHASQLANGLLAIAQNAQMANSERSPYGTKYTLDGQLETPKGVMILVRTIWIVEKGQDAPRFVTAYPIE